MQEVYLQGLWATSREGEGLDFAITKFPCVVGRQSDCDHRIGHSLISRRHCSFFVRGDTVWVEDLGSRNGSYLNGEQLSSAQPLHDEDRLDLGCLPFRVRLPVSAAAPAVKPVAVEPEPSGQPRHVLVVEDNEDAAETLAMLLQEWGHEVQVAHDGPQAIQAAQAHPPDAVLLDIHLPGMDGYKVAQRLRRQAGLEEALLVGMTGYPHDQDSQRHQEVGFQHLLTKPVDPKTLQAVISHS